LLPGAKLAEEGAGELRNTFLLKFHKMGATGVGILYTVGNFAPTMIVGTRGERKMVQIIERIFPDL